MPLKRNWFLSIAIETLFWSLWRRMALSCRKRLVFVCLAWPLLDLWTGSHIQSIAEAASRKVGSLYMAQHCLSPESILYLYKSTIRSCMEYCSHIWGGAPRSHGLDLLDRVRKRVVSLVGSVLSSDLYYYGKCSSKLAGLSFINQAFFLAP